MLGTCGGRPVPPPTGGPSGWLTGCILPLPPHAGPASPSVWVASACRAPLELPVFSAPASLARLGNGKGAVGLQVEHRSPTYTARSFFKTPLCLAPHEFSRSPRKEGRSLFFLFHSEDCIVPLMRGKAVSKSGLLTPGRCPGH